MKVVVAIAMALVMSGCSIVYSDIKEAYVAAKVVYSDAKYVLYEIEDEVERVKEERAGK